MGFNSNFIKICQYLRIDFKIVRGSLFQSSDAETENEREPYDAKQNLLGCSRKAEDGRKFLSGVHLSIQSFIDKTLNVF